MSDLKRVEKFTVDAPVDWVWKLLLSAEQLMACLPGARLDGHELVGEEEEQLWRGAVSFKVGVLTVELAGNATLSDVDYFEHSFKLCASAHDKDDAQSDSATQLVATCKLVAIPAEGIEDPTEAEAAEQCAAAIEIETTLAERLARMDRVLVEEAGLGLIEQLIGAVRTRMADAKAAIAREALRSELDALKGVLDESARELEAAQNPPQADPDAPQAASGPAELSGKKRAADKKRRSSEANMKLLPIGPAQSAELSGPRRALHQLRGVLQDLGRRLSRHVKELIEGPLRRLLRRGPAG